MSRTIYGYTNRHSRFCLDYSSSKIVYYIRRVHGSTTVTEYKH